MPASPAALRQQDRQECATQAAQQGLAKRKQVEFVRKCLIDRETARNAAARKKAPEEWAAQQALLEKRAAKEAGCKKQARQQKLHYENRLRFIEKCMAE